MKIDLHIHSKDGSDGRWTLEAIFAEAHKRHFDLISITDHDSIHAQEQARALAQSFGIAYLTGVELNVTFSHPNYKKGKPVSLDVLGCQYDIHHPPLVEKLKVLREHRKRRAEQILENLNREFVKAGLEQFTPADLEAIEASVDGTLGRPHIADYLIKRGIVATKQEAFDRYLVQCDVPKMPLSLREASELIRGAGGRMMLAHPNDPNGTSLVTLTTSLQEQIQIIQDTMMAYIDGIECWHSRHDRETMQTYEAFAQTKGLMVSGGSDCHQDPVLMGEVEIPDYVGEQFLRDTGIRKDVTGASR
ncbi:MAG: PHP domain-containing protein [Deltaproteobacteria bacterium]|nr:PHP domain-containing protein [Deltaproteobacteria bacterium]